MNIFEIATREKYRFSFKGLISTEDLWDLSVKDLDSIFRKLNYQAKEIEEESLLEAKTSKDLELDTKIKIIRYIVEVKLNERNKAIRAKENKDKKQKLMSLIAEKQDEKLKNMSEEELRNMINELD